MGLIRKLRRPFRERRFRKLMFKPVLYKKEWAELKRLDRELFRK